MRTLRPQTSCFQKSVWVLRPELVRTLSWGVRYWPDSLPCGIRSEGTCLCRITLASLWKDSCESTRLMHDGCLRGGCSVRKTSFRPRQNRGLNIVTRGGGSVVCSSITVGSVPRASTRDPLARTCAAFVSWESTARRRAQQHAKAARQVFAGIPPQARARAAPVAQQAGTRQR